MVVDPNRKVRVIWMVGCFFSCLFGGLYLGMIVEGWEGGYRNGFVVLMIVGCVLLAIAALGWYWEDRNARLLKTPAVSSG